MPQFESKGVIVFPDDRCLAAFVACLRMIHGEKMYEEVRRFRLSLREIEVPDVATFKIPVMLVNCSNEWVNTAQEAVAHVITQFAEECGYPFRVYVQDVTRAYGDYQIECLLNWNATSVRKLLNESEDWVKDKQYEWIVGAMKGVIDDTYLSMRVSFCSDDGDIDSELHHLSVDDLLTTNQPTVKEESI